MSEFDSKLPPLEHPRLVRLDRMPPAPKGMQWHVMPIKKPCEASHPSACPLPLTPEGELDLGYLQRLMLTTTSMSFSDGNLRVEATTLGGATRIFEGPFKGTVTITNHISTCTPSDKK